MEVRRHSPASEVGGVFLKIAGYYVAIRVFIVLKNIAGFKGPDETELGTEGQGKSISRVYLRKVEHVLSKARPKLMSELDFT